jgi:D-3-phosphoglycerate dehydrogenase
VGAHRSLGDGEWRRSDFAGVELAGRTLGIVGYGRVGRQVARRLTAFDMRILVHDPYADTVGDDVCATGRPQARGRPLPAPAGP